MTLVACGGSDPVAPVTTNDAALDSSPSASPDTALDAAPDVEPEAASAPPTLTIPDSCASANVTVNAVYNAIIETKCATASCHAQGQTPPSMSGGASAFRGAVVNVSAGRGAMPDMFYVKPNDPDKSFLLYKVLGQQAKIQFGGAQEPQGSPPLSADEQCQLINWVRSGAQ